MSSVLRAISLAALGSLVFAFVLFVAAEIALRLLFWEGQSFGSHFGPIVERFEKDFQYNGYDGPSRGPSITGAKENTALRVLVQGDSITWGAGVKDEEVLYTSSLLSALQRRNPETEMAVLANPGREVDGHLQQLEKWGRTIQPDIIVYQWYVNDIEFNKSRVPTRPRVLWQKPFFHGFMVRNSYLWFFLDYHLTRIFYTNPSRYFAYLEAQFGPGTEGWREFADVFSAWSEEAKALTPHVLVFLYPIVGEGLLVLPQTVEDIHRRFHELCEQNAVTCVDAIDWLKPLGSFREMRATLYDRHPNARTHWVIAQALEDRLVDTWPELFD